MLKERGTKEEREGEGRRSEKEWSVINLIKKLNARARRVVGKWIDHGLALGVLLCLSGTKTKRKEAENGKRERRKGRKEEGRKKGQRQSKRRERERERKGGKKRTVCVVSPREIDAYVGGYLRSGTCWQWYGRRYTWTIAGNRSFIDPSHLRQPGLRATTILSIRRATWSVKLVSWKRERGLAHSWLLFAPLLADAMNARLFFYIAFELSK